MSSASAIWLTKRWLQFSLREQWLVFEAVIYLLFVRLVFALPFKTALRLIGARSGSGVDGSIDGSKAAAISVAINRAARYVPFRAVCLQQAFASLLMLRRRDLKATVHFGVRHRTNSLLAAHAWSLSGEIPVTGQDVSSDYIGIAVFTA